jgi:NADH-quinone oxidoreductase subunit J
MLFYVFAAAMIVTSLLVVGQRSPMYSVLWLIASFGALAAIYLQLGATFIAVIQIIIYAGAIMVLFLFVVMLLAVGHEGEGGRIGVPPGAFQGVRRFGAMLTVVLAFELAWALVGWRARAGTAESAGLLGAETSVRELGVLLFKEYAFAFEATSILILVAMVGAVVLARPERDEL